MEYGKQFQQAFNFAFNEVFGLWSGDLKKIFRIGTKSKKLGGCNLSACILVIIGIESFSKFYLYNKNKGVQSFIKFIDKYFDEYYRGKMGRIYGLFRNGLAHYFYPKSILKAKSYSQIAYFVDDRTKNVFTLQKIHKDITTFRNQQILNPSKGQSFRLMPQVIFLDTIEAIKGFKKDLITSSNRKLRNNFINNYMKIKNALGHF